MLLHGAENYLSIRGVEGVSQYNSIVIRCSIVVVELVVVKLSLSSRKLQL